MVKMTISPPKLKKISAKNGLKIYNEYKNTSSNTYAINTSEIGIQDTGGKMEHYAIMNDQKVIGYIQGYSPVRSDNFWIQLFVVDPSYRHQKIGSYSYKLLIEQIQLSRPLTKVYLACYDANDIGKQFWQSLSFKPTTQLSINTNDMRGPYTVYYNLITPIQTG